MEISRRTFLLGSLSAAFLAACTSDEDDRQTTDVVPTRESVELPAPAAPAVALGAAPFGLGVASGDPDATSVVLWTRLLGAEGDHEVAWEVEDDRGTRVAAGLVTATAGDAHSVHVVAEVPPGPLTYRFHTAEHTSPDGRTSAVPEEASECRFAFASCQDWRDGHWSAHEHLAAEDVDLVVFLGDYIYEGGDGDGQVRQHGAPECTTLDDYRTRYALYKAHPSLQAAHAARPWVVVWDDHEVENDHAGGDDESMDRARQAAGYKAWWEHMPVRMPAPTGPALDINRTVRWGDLVTFITLDGRQFRSDQACGGGIEPSCPEVDEPGRTMLGARQEAWVADALSGSDTTWNVLANQTILAPSEIVGLVNMDQWDGYPAARARLYEAMRAASGTNVVITGDVHASAAGDLLDGDGTVLGVELVGTSMSSSFPADLVDLFEAAATGAGAAFADAGRRGYVRCTVTPERLTADYRVVESVAVETSPVSTGSSWVINASEVGIKPL